MKRLYATLGLIAVIALAGAGVWRGYCQVFVDTRELFVRIDNTRVGRAEGNSNGFDYRYELTAADAAGKTEPVSFDTSRELRDDAYLKLETLALRGVVRWEEVRAGEVPEPALDAIG